MKVVRLAQRAALLLLAALAPGAALPADDPATRLVAAARAQVGVTVVYDPSYRGLAYPGGDLPPERGVCTDVVIRAYRALGLDLQVAVHEDMRQAWAEYPRRWGLAAPDPNIDHRRVANLVTYFTRRGAALPAPPDPAAYRPGDLVTWRLPSGADHIGLVSDRKQGERPLVLHNIGAGAAEEDVLLAWPLTGHYRFLLEHPAPGAVSRADSDPHGRLAAAAARAPADARGTRVNEPDSGCAARPE